MAAKAFYAVVAGVGPGTGKAVALRFAKTYPVVLLARRPESYNNLVQEINNNGGQAIGISTDTSDSKSVTSAFEFIKQQLPEKKLAAAIFNVGSGFLAKPFLDTTADELDSSLSGDARGLFNFAQSTLPLLLESVPDSPHPPSLLVTGATASLRGSAKFAAFAAGKFAKRALAQSLAREFGPKGVHVAHVIIDGIIDTPRSRAWGPDSVPDAIMNPGSIAETYWHLHTQHRSAFAHELDLRPYVEKF